MESNDVESSNVETAEGSSLEAAESITSAPAANPAESATEGKNEKRSDYENLIAAAKACITENAGQIPEGYDFSVGILTSRGLGTLGYLIEDIDGNGTDELIFGLNGTDADGVWGTVIYDIYTIDDGELVHVLDGWERNRYYLCENGLIANEGSSGAGNSNYAYFTFEESQLQLVEAVICDGMKDADHPWFYSTESEYDAEYAESISEERADEIMEKYEYKQLVFTPFAEDE